jgi:hypothetical protein
LCVSDPFFDAQTLRRKEDDEDEEEQMRAIVFVRTKYHNTHSPPHKNAGRTRKNKNKNNNNNNGGD